MKKLPITLLLLALISLVACKQPASQESTTVEEIEESVTSETEAPDYAAFGDHVALARNLFQAHMDEDLEKLSGLIADTLKWSPPNYNGNEFLGKDDYLAALKQYHTDFDNITFTEGIPLPSGEMEPGHWSGSYYPEDKASSKPTAIRIYGTWTATHTATGKEIGVKLFGIAWPNADGKMAMLTDYFDAHGIAAQIAAE